MPSDFQSLDRDMRSGSERDRSEPVKADFGLKQAEPRVS